MTQRIHIAIIDCAIEELSITCFNRLVQMYDQKFSYHPISCMGAKSLDLITPDAYIVFGSYSNISNRLRWHKQLSTFITSELEKKKPVLGICFAHQLIADFFGARVEEIKRNSSNSSCNGQREIQMTTDILNLKKNDKIHIFTSHSYEVSEVPTDFYKIAQSDECAIEGLAHKKLPFYSFQGHPEASRYFVNGTINTVREKDLTELEFQQAQKGGDKIISGFLSTLG